MTREVLVIVLVNLLFALLGAGLMMLLAVARTPKELLVRSPLAYAFGLAGGGVATSTLELVGIAVGEAELTVLAVATLAAGGFRLSAGPPRADAARRKSSRTSLGAGLVALGFALVLVLHAAYAYSVRPLREWDGWVIWATKAKSLYVHGGVNDAVFASEAYEHSDYPLLLPTLEAIGFRALGAFDGTHVHLQLAGLALAFVAAAWTISRASASPAVTGLAILAAISAPAVLSQLGWNYADVPLAMFCALGGAGLAGWLRTDQTWLLTVGVTFLAAGASTKSEGLMYSLAALAAAFVVVAATRRDRLAAAGVGLACLVAAILPWRLYVLVHGLRPQDYDLSKLADPTFLADASYRLRPVTIELARQMTSTASWGLIVPLAACAFATALLRGSYGVAGFGALWLAGSLAGLLLIYWISEHTLSDNLLNTSYRVIATPMLGAAMLVPPLVGELVSTASDEDL